MKNRHDQIHVRLFDRPTEDQTFSVEACDLSPQDVGADGRIDLAFLDFVKYVAVSDELAENFHEIEFQVQKRGC